MRLVIPYRLSGEGLELRYAIRSMVKHFKPLSGVLIIGDKPEWYRGDHIARADLKGEKEKSMMLKVLAAPDPVFLYSNDDFFAAADFGPDLPNYYDVPCEELAIRHPQADYRKMYFNCGPAWLNYDIHTPMIMQKARFITQYSRMDEQTPIKTTYANGLTGAAYLCDMKIRGEHTAAELVDLTRDRPFFSTHDSAVNVDLIDFLNTLYPNASCYE